jgi:large subunit ribosomal protein L21
VYAIVQNGGHQVKMVPGALITVDLIAGDAGSEVAFDKVLFVQGDGGEITAGSPFVAGARVLGVLEGEARGPKIRVFVKKRRKGMRRTKGHRSTLSRVRVKEILL